MVPLEFLQSSKTKRVEVHTVDKNVYIGILSDFDPYVNIVLDSCELLEFEAQKTIKLGKTIVQGNNVAFIEIQ